MSDQKTNTLVEQWERAIKTRERALDEFQKAQIEEMRAINTLGQWLTPDDAHFGDAFSIWYRGMMLEIHILPGKMEEGPGFSIKWRASKRVYPEAPTGYSP